MNDIAAWLTGTVDAPVWILGVVCVSAAYLGTRGWFAMRNAQRTRKTEVRLNGWGQWQPTVTISITKRFAVRLWLSLQLMKVAVWLADLNAKYAMLPDSEELESDRDHWRNQALALQAELAEHEQERGEL